MGVKLMYYEQFRCIMHWFRLNQGLSNAFDSVGAVQGSMRLSEHFVLKNFFFSPPPPHIILHSVEHEDRVGLKDKLKYYF